MCCLCEDRALPSSVDTGLEVLPEVVGCRGGDAVEPIVAWMKANRGELNAREWAPERRKILGLLAEIRTLGAARALYAWLDTRDNRTRQLVGEYFEANADLALALLPAEARKDTRRAEKVRVLLERVLACVRLWCGGVWCGMRCRVIWDGVGRYAVEAFEVDHVTQFTVI